MTHPPVIFLLGFSGVGKSTFSNYLQVHQAWLWIELDQTPMPVGDGINCYPINGKIDEKYIAFVKNLCTQGNHSGVIVSLRSTMIIDERRTDYLKSIGVSVIYLTASESFCLHEFEKREALIGRGFRASHWIKYNLNLCIFLESIEDNTPLNLISVVNELGVRRSPKEIFDLILGKMDDSFTDKKTPHP
jgi:hypothetical protein